jgi:hypothetical protein
MKNNYFKIAGALIVLTMMFCFAACEQPISKKTGGTPVTPTLPESSAPTATDTTVTKTSSDQTTATFTLTSAPAGTWKVYTAPTGGEALTTVRASFTASNLTLTLTSSDGPLAARTYYVSVKETDKSESPRLALTVKPSEEEGSFLPDIETKIKKAEIFLGDLSTVASDITLPASDSAVTVRWSSSAPLVFSDTGTVTRPSTNTSLTLTGTFTSAANPLVSLVKTWNVQVLGNSAPISDYLVLDLQFENGHWVNKAFSGDFYEPTLAGTAALQSQSGYDVINLGTGGYIDLGPKLGSLLRKSSEWTVEFNIYAENNSGTLFSFANDDNINNTNADSWRGTVSFTVPGLAFYAANNGRNGYSTGDDQRDTETFIITGRSYGLPTPNESNSQLNRWTHVMICKSNNYIGIFRYGVHAQNDKGYSFVRLTESNAFDAADDETWPLQYGYLGRSAFESITSVTGENVKIVNGKFANVKFYSKSLVDLTGGDVTWGDFFGDRKSVTDAMNTAFSYPAVVP